MIVVVDLIGVDVVLIGCRVIPIVFSVDVVDVVVMPIKVVVESVIELLNLIV